VRQTAVLRQGLSQDLAREISKLIRDRLPKLKTQIQGDAVRVTGKSKDELQAAQQLLRKAEQERSWPVPLQFVNYR
jgi:cyclic-di-GMP-binding protein